MRREKITGDDAKKRIIRYVSILKADYDRLWQRYREVVHENAMLAVENDKLRNGVSR